MAKTLEDYLKENPNLSLSGADMALGRQNFGALEQIIQARKDWSNATTREEKDAAHNRAEVVRKWYGDYSGGDDGMKGQYSPTYVKPDRAANNENVEALFNKFNNIAGKKAPTWTPRYEEEIAGILSDLGEKGPFKYDMANDPMYQQYRDQYIREGKRAMEDTAAQTAAMTGGYGSTYGSIAAQQGYDRYLSQLNDRVPQLEQMAYGRHADEIADMYNRLGAYQSEEQRLYGQFRDELNQSNIDRDFSFNALQAALGQNNYENEFDRGIFESDRGYGLQKDAADFQKQQAAIDLALATGDYSALKDLGINTGYLDLMKAADEAQARAQIGKLQGIVSGGTSGGGTKSSGGTKSKSKSVSGGNPSGNGGNTTPKKEDGYMQLVALYKLHGDTLMFQSLANQLVKNGKVTEADYNRVKKMAQDDKAKNGFRRG